MAQTYNFARQNLALKHVSALKNLDTIYGMKAKGFISQMIGFNDNDIEGFVSNNLPAFLKPFQQSSAQLGFSFYNLRRQQAETISGKAFQKLGLTANDLPYSKLIETSLPPTGMLINMIKQASALDDVNQATPFFTQVTAKSIATPNRLMVSELSDNDPVSTGTVRVAAPDGCSFCKMGASLWGSDMIDTDPVEFHNHCSCVIDSSFKNESKYKQEFSPTWNKDYENTLKIMDDQGIQMNVKNSTLVYERLQSGDTGKNIRDLFDAKQAEKEAKQQAEKARKQELRKQVLAARQ